MFPVSAGRSQKPSKSTQRRWQEKGVGKGVGGKMIPKLVIHRICFFKRTTYLPKKNKLNS